MTSDTSPQQPVVRAPAVTIAQASPSLVLLGAAGLSPLWGVFLLHWSVLAVVMAYIAQTAAAGFLAYARAKGAAGQSTRPDDDVMVREFFKTYVTVVIAAALIATMVFGGRLLRPQGGRPDGVDDAFSTWQYWAVVAALVAAEVGVYLLDRARGGWRELPPETFVAEPLRRLFLLQGAVLALGLIVYWRGSSQAGTALIVVAAAAGVVLMAALARLREARIRAALEAGAELKQARPAKVQRRAGRKRGRGR
jgi:hypothetical protein